MTAETVISLTWILAVSPSWRTVSRDPVALNVKSREDAQETGEFRTVTASGSALMLCIVLWYVAEMLRVPEWVNPALAYF